MGKNHFYVNASQKKLSESGPNTSEILGNYMIFSA